MVSLALYYIVDNAQSVLVVVLLFCYFLFFC